MMFAVLVLIDRGNSLCSCEGNDTKIIILRFLEQKFTAKKRIYIGFYFPFIEWFKISFEFV